MCDEVNRQKGQTRKMDAAVAALLSERTVADAAAKCGISRRTMQAWLKHEGFRQQYDAAKKELLDGAINRLRTIGCDASRALERVLSNEKTPPAATVSASKTVLELLMKNREVEEIERRISALEVSLRGSD
jgi:transposase-like protein